MTNVISQIFSFPGSGRDQEAVDLLELHVCSDSVQAVRDAKSREDASRITIELSNRLDGAKSLSRNQKRWLRDWLSVISQMLNDSDKLPWPLCNRVGGRTALDEQIRTQNKIKKGKRKRSRDES